MADAALSWRDPKPAAKTGPRAGGMGQCAVRILRAAIAAVSALLIVSMTAPASLGAQEDAVRSKTQAIIEELAKKAVFASSDLEKLWNADATVRREFEHRMLADADLLRASNPYWPLATTVAVPHKIADLARRLSEKLDSTTKPEEIEALAKAIGTIGRLLDPPGAASTVRALGNKVVGERELYGFRWEAVWALGNAAANLDAGAAASEVKALREALAATKDSHQTSELCKALAFVGMRLDPDDAVEEARILRIWLAAEPDSSRRQGLSDVMSAFGTRLPPKEAADTARFLRERLAKTTDYSGLVGLTVAYRSVAARLDPDDAAREEKALREWHETSSNPNMRKMLASARGGLSGSLAPQDAAKQRDALQDKLARSDNGYGEQRELMIALESGVERAIVEQSPNAKEFPKDRPDLIRELTSKLLASDGRGRSTDFDVRRVARWAGRSEPFDRLDAVLWLLDQLFAPNSAERLDILTFSGLFRAMPRTRQVAGDTARHSLMGGRF